MADLIAAKNNMIANQLRPMGVSHPAVLAAFEQIPRELFLPEQWVNLAYADQPIPSAPGRPASLCLHEIARCMQAVYRRTRSVVLLGAEPYVTALLATMADAVTVIDPDERALAALQRQMALMNIPHVTACAADFQSACDTMRESLVWVDGSIATVPDWLRDVVAPAGHLVVVEGERPVMQACVYHYGLNEQWQRLCLFETLQQRAPGFVA